MASMWSIKKSKSSQKKAKYSSKYPYSEQDPCKLFNFNKRLEVADWQLNPDGFRREDGVPPQMNWIQVFRNTIKTATDVDKSGSEGLHNMAWEPLDEGEIPQRIKDKYKKPGDGVKAKYVKKVRFYKRRRGKPSTAIITRSFTYQLLKDIAKSPFEIVDFHSEAIAKENIERIFDDVDVQYDTLLVISTNTACYRCTKKNYIQDLCDKTKFKNCVYLYGDIWKGYGGHNAQDLTKSLKEAGFNVVRQCPGVNKIPTKPADEKSDDQAVIEYLNVAASANQGDVADARYGGDRYQQNQYHIKYDADYKELSSNPHTSNSDLLLVYGLGLATGVIVVGGCCAILLVISYLCGVLSRGIRHTINKDPTECVNDLDETINQL